MIRTFDYRIVKRIVNHSDWFPAISNDVIYLVEDDSLWAFHDYLDGLMVHVVMNINCRGKQAIEKGKKALRWAFDNTSTEIIYGSIDKDNKAACHNARHTGMKFMNEKDNMRHYEVRKCSS